MEKHRGHLQIYIYTLQLDPTSKIPCRRDALTKDTDLGLHVGKNIIRVGKDLHPKIGQATPGEVRVFVEGGSFPRFPQV